MDKLLPDPKAVHLEKRPFVTFSEEVDRIYLDRQEDGANPRLGDPLQVSHAEWYPTRNGITQRVNPTLGDPVALQLYVSEGCIEVQKRGGYVRGEWLEGFGVDVVAWNPWAAKAAKMDDFGDEEYVGMVCLEPGLVNGKTALEPGGQAVLTQEIKFAPHRASASGFNEPQQVFIDRGEGLDEEGTRPTLLSRPRTPPVCHPASRSACSLQAAS